MILNILVILLGISLLVYSFFEIRVWGSLYFDRDTHCLEKYRKATKTADMVSFLHNVVKFVFGFALVVSGLRRWMPMESAVLVRVVLFVSFALLVLDALVLEGITRARRLKELREEIREQWHREKRITPEHNHEVNLFRGAVRVTQTYPRQLLAMGTGMLFTLAFMF